MHPIVIRLAVLCAALKVASVLGTRRAAIWTGLATAFALNLLPAVMGGRDLHRLAVGIIVDAIICVPVLLVLARDISFLVWVVTVSVSALLLFFEIPTFLILDH